MTRFGRNLILLVIFLQAANSIIAQPVDSLDFSEVDSFVLKVKFENNYIKLAKDLGTPFHLDVYKVRAIFKWITNNIYYDYRFVNSGRELEVPDCADKYNCADILRSWENEYIKKILRTRRATAEGYAKLFKKLCDIDHIQCELISGYARTKPYQIGNKMSANHTWNAVYIDTAWYFLDVTWASGYTVENEETDKLVKYVKDFQNYYWLMPFARLARNHYPKSNYWDKQYNSTVDDFYNRPHYYSIEVLENISNECQASGIIMVKKNDTINFNFDYKKDIHTIQVNSNTFRNPSMWTTVTTAKRKTKIVRDTWAEKKQVYIPFKKQGHNYTFDYVVKDMSLYYIELVFDYKKAIRYKVTVGK